MVTTSLKGAATFFTTKTETNIRSESKERRYTCIIFVVELCIIYIMDMLDVHVVIFCFVGRLPLPHLGARNLKFLICSKHCQTWVHIEH